MATAAERQRRSRAHKRGDHSLCNPAYCRPGDPGGLIRWGVRQIEGPQALYRLFGHGDELLYIGITMNPSERLRVHRDEKPWWTDVARITVDHYPSREAVEQAEREAIAAEHPRWNVVHNGGGSGRSEAVATATPSAQSVLTVSHAGTQIRIESVDSIEALTRSALEIVATLRGRGNGHLH